jgi:formylglycine-generating enzyme required for sulfatase activity
MARFGNYETDRPLYRTGFNAIYLSRSGTKDAGQRLIKAYEPSASARDERLVAAESAAFLDSAGVQQKAASGDARYWAPIYECGTSPEGVFYVTDYYDLSAQQLIDGRVKLDSAGLCHIVESVTKGLVALKRACERPHGNLKFTNILIAKRRALTSQKVVLSDPCPASLLDKDTHAKMDLMQLGVLIHQLVMHRDPPLVAGYEVPDSPEWQRLGRRANAWRNLCNRLLTMDAQAEPLTLEELAARLPGIARRGRDRAFKVAACLCVTVLLAVLYRPAADRIKNLLWPPDPEEVRKAYAECYQAGDWLIPLWRQLTEKVPRIGKKRYDYWKNEDKALKKLTDLVYYDFAKPFTDRSKTDVNIPKNPPEKLATDVRYQNSVLDSNTALAEIEVLLSNGEKGWSAPKELAGDAASLREARCESMAAYADALLGSIWGHDEKVAEHIDDVLHLKTNWYKVQYTELEPNAVEMDPNLTAPVRDAEDFVKRLHKLPDNYRQNIDAFTDLLAAETQLRDKLRDVVAGGDEKAETLQVELNTSVSDRIREIRSIPFTRANAPRVTSKCKIIHDRIREIDLQIRDADQWFDQWRADANDPNRIGSSPAMRAAYLMRLDNDRDIGTGRDAFISTHKGKWDKLRGLRERVEQLQMNLRRLDTRLPQTIAAKSSSAPWTDKISEYYRSSKREELIRRITGMLAQQEPFPEPNDYPGGCTDLLEWPSRTIALMNDFTDIEKGLDNCYLLDETPVGARASLRSLYTDSNHGRILDDELVKQVLAPLTARLDRLRHTLDDISDVNVLLTEAGEAPALEAKYAAWHKLVSQDLVVGKWPEEEKVRNPLMAELESRYQEGRLPEIRRTELTREMKETGEAREQQFRKRSIDGLADLVAAKAGDVALLHRLKQFTPADLPALRAFHTSLESLWNDCVNSDDWPAQYDLGQFDKDHPSERADTGAIIAWLSEVPQYRRIEDQRDTSRWDESWRELTRSIEEGLSDRKDDAAVADKLGKARTDLLELDQRFKAIRDLPAIKKNEERITQSIELWRRMEESQENVNSLLDPAYRHLTFSTGVARFKDKELDQFEPIGPNLTPFRRDDLKEDLRDSFFTVMDRGDRQNAGWPKYLRAKEEKDSTVILVFVPGDKQVPPFYIAQCEITNRQYARFLASTRPADYGSLVKDTLFPENHPYPSAIDSDSYGVKDPNRIDHPVVWVTEEGAKSYALWLSKNATLPKASWYRRAIEYSEAGIAKHADPSLYHMRTKSYLAEVQKYNESLTNQDALGGVGNRIPPPWGAAHEFNEFKGLKPGQPLANVASATDEPGTAWPQASRKTPPLVVFDLLGNVWEWCVDDANGDAVMCGGSCLEDPQIYASQDVRSPPPSRGAECDLGFRVAIQCP